MHKYSSSLLYICMYKKAYIFFALDDCKNIANILKAIAKTGYVFRQTGQIHWKRNHLASQHVYKWCGRHFPTSEVVPFGWHYNWGRITHVIIDRTLLSFIYPRVWLFWWQSMHFYNDIFIINDDSFFLFVYILQKSNRLSSWF